MLSRRIVRAYLQRRAFQPENWEIAEEALVQLIAALWTTKQKLAALANEVSSKRSALNVPELQGILEQDVLEPLAVAGKELGQQLAADMAAIEGNLAKSQDALRGTSLETPWKLARMFARGLTATSKSLGSNLEWQKFAAEVRRAMVLQDGLHSRVTGEDPDLEQLKEDGDPLWHTFWFLGNDRQTGKVRRRWTVFWSVVESAQDAVGDLSSRMHKLRSQLAGSQNRQALALLDESLSALERTSVDNPML